MQKTAIEWVKNPDGTQGYTWNPITGCNNHIDGLCQGGGFPCYAHRLANTRLKERYLANKNTDISSCIFYSFGIFLDDYGRLLPFYPRFWPEKLDQPLKRKKPAGIFVCDMSDLFGLGVPVEWTRQVLATIRACPQHRFYLLTKQPQNLPKTFPDNCYVGVTATSQPMLTIATDYLSGIEAKVKYISFEPLLSSPSTSDYIAQELILGGINWVIIGAQTQPKVYPEVEWIQEIVKAADSVGIAVFLKNNLLRHQTYLRHLRQEVPN